MPQYTPNFREILYTDCDDILFSLQSKLEPKLLSKNIESLKIILKEDINPDLIPFYIFNGSLYHSPNYPISTSIFDSWIFMPSDSPPPSLFSRIKNWIVKVVARLHD